MARLGPSRLAPDAKDPLPLSLLSWIPGHRDFSDLRIRSSASTYMVGKMVIAIGEEPLFLSTGLLESHYDMSPGFPQSK